MTVLFQNIDGLAEWIKRQHTASLLKPARVGQRLGFDTCTCSRCKCTAKDHRLHFDELSATLNQQPLARRRVLPEYAIIGKESRQSRRWRQVKPVVADLAAINCVQLHLGRSIEVKV